MHIHTLSLASFGQFENLTLDFGGPGQFALVYGPNEAGKSTTLKALEALLFGYDRRKKDSEGLHMFGPARVGLEATISGANAVLTDVRWRLAKNTERAGLKGSALESLWPTRESLPLFTQLFALNGERLHHEAVELFKEDMTADHLLASAVFGESLSQRLDALKKEESELLAKRHSITAKARINALTNEIRSLEQEAKDSQVNFSDFHDRKLSIDALTRELKALEQQRAQLKHQAQILAKDKQRLDCQSQLARAQQAAEVYADLPDFSPASLTEYETLNERITKAQANLEAAKAQQQSLQQERSQLVLNPKLWQARDKLQASLQAWTSWQDRQQQLASHDAEAAQKHAALSQDLKLVLATPQAWAALDTALGELTPVKSPAWPSVPADMGTRATLEALLALDTNAMRRAVKDQEALQRRREDLAQRRMGLALDAQEARIRLKQLEDKGAGVSQAQVIEARRARDLLWGKLKRDLSHAALQDQFEQAQADADRLADAFALAQLLEGDWQTAQNALTEVAINLEQLDVQLGDLDTQATALSTELAVLMPRLEPTQTLRLWPQADALRSEWQAAQRQDLVYQSYQQDWQKLQDQARALGADHSQLAQPSALKAWIKAKSAMKAQLVALADTAQRYEALRAQCDQAEQAWQQATQSLPQGLAGQDLPPAQRMATLKQALLEEHAAQTAADRLEQRHEKQALQVQQLAQAVTSLQDQRASLGLPQDQSLTRLREAQDVRQALAHWQAQHDALGATQVCHALADWQDQYAACEQAQTALDSRWQAMTQDRANQEAALRSLTQSDAALEARVRRQSKREALARAVERYIDVAQQAALLEQAQSRFSQARQAGLLAAASQLFARLTAGRYTALEHSLIDGVSQLWAHTQDGEHKHLNQLSEGSKDQLLLALRLAAIDRFGLERLGPLPLVCDDLLVQFDDERASKALDVLADRCDRQQVVYFTHHKHMITLAQEVLGKSRLHVMQLGV